jgi:hypothetical protein
VCGREEVNTRFWWENLRERDNMQDPISRWEDNVKMNLQEVECGDMDWIDLVQDRRRALVSAVMNIRFP